MNNEKHQRFVEGNKPTGGTQRTRLSNNGYQSDYGQKGHQPKTTLKPSDVKPPRSGSSVTPGKKE